LRTTNWVVPEESLMGKKDSVFDTLLDLAKVSRLKGEHIQKVITAQGAANQST
jgi:hypothetical protein